MPGSKGEGCMEVSNKRGCALCDATWGQYWDDVDGQRMVFCCSICASAFKNMVKAVKENNSWAGIDTLDISGNNNVGRKCSASAGGRVYRFYIRFHDDGSIEDFHSL